MPGRPRGGTKASFHQGPESAITGRKGDTDHEPQHQPARWASPFPRTGNALARTPIITPVATADRRVAGRSANQEDRLLVITDGGASNRRPLRGSPGRAGALDGGTPGGVRSGRLTGPHPAGLEQRTRVMRPSRRLNDAEREQRREQDRQRLHQAAQQLLTSEGWERWMRVRAGVRPRASRETSSAKITPTCPRPTSAASSRSPIRACAHRADCPLFSSTTSAVRDRLSRKNPGCGPGCGAVLDRRIAAALIAIDASLVPDAGGLRR